MKWFDNMIRRIWNRGAVLQKIEEGASQPPRLHGSHLSDMLNGRVCAMVYSIDNGFILINQDPTSGATKFIHAKDAVEVGETIARQLTLQRMGVVQGSSIRGAESSAHPATLTVKANQLKASVSGF